MSVNSPVESLNPTQDLCRQARDRMHSIKNMRTIDLFQGINFKEIPAKEIQDNVLQLLCHYLSVQDKRPWSKLSAKKQKIRKLYRG